jgi:hypothetical protein
MTTPAEKPLRVTAFFERMGLLFTEGRLEELAGLWHFPCPIMLDSQILLLRNRAGFLTHMTAQRDAALAQGPVTIVPLVSAVEIPRYGRLRVWMRWRTTSAQGVVDDQFGSVFYLSRSPQGVLCVEMIETSPRFTAQPTRATA